MSSRREERVRRLVEEAAGVPPQERAAFLDARCGDDAELRAAVEARLAALTRTHGPFGEAESTLSAPGLESVGDTIGRYKLLQIIGEGGFGSVYMAEQQEPVRRRVALKVIKLGMDTREVIARFEAERQALAMMDHPNIAHVLDAGATPTGRPYFVMELVKGMPITRYCDEHNFSIRERLELFRRVCSAVQHAHQKGIIHRDLKPSNVLVTHQDGEVVPKIIDFGIAKATSARLTERTVYTELGKFIGTPEYMAPEQAETTGLDVDTRADIYSLGVLLYELLTGVTPFDGAELRKAGYASIQRVLREVEPPRPSTRLSMLDTVDAVAARRRIDAKELGLLLRGDLDWIVMKAIEKDRTRRYETANALSEDIRRHLDSEPVSASPPSTLYRLRKFVRRNKGPVAAASLVAAALVAGIIATTWALVWALEERSRATLAEEEAIRRAGELEKVAAFQAAQLGEIEPASMGLELREGILRQARSGWGRAGLGADETETRLEELRDHLARANLTTVALEVLDRTIFERSLAAIDEEFADQPLVQARLLQSVGVTMRELGLLEAAVEPLEEAIAIRRAELGEAHLETLEAIEAYTVLLSQRGDHGEAIERGRQILAERRRVLGDDHLDTLRALHNVAFYLDWVGDHDEALSYYLEALEGRRRVLGDEHPETLSTRQELGGNRWLAGQPQEAMEHWRPVLEARLRLLGEDHPDSIVSLGSMGFLLEAMGRAEEAKPYTERALEAARRVLGDAHPNTLSSLNNMAFLLKVLGRPEEALPLFEEALETRRRVLGADHTYTLISLHNMGVVLEALGRGEEALGYYRQALEGRRSALGPDHPDTLLSMESVAALLREMDRHEEALELASRAVAKGRETFSDDHWRLGVLLVEQGRTLAAAGRRAEAFAAAEEAHSILSSALGEDDRRTADAAALLDRLGGT